MSFLNSVISSIGDGQTLQRPVNAPLKPPAAVPARPRPAPTQDSQSLKRKIDQRDGQAPCKQPSAVSLKERPVKATPLQKSTTPVPRQPSTASGVSKPAASGNPAPSNGSAAPAAAAPKKGYLAILERAKAAQEAARPLGQITHQKTTEKERISRQEKQRRAAEAAAAAKTNKSLNAQRNGTSTASQPRPHQVTAKRKVEVAYKGTMRPAAAKPAYTGTMRPSAPLARARGTTQAHSAPPRPMEYSDEEDDEEEEEEDDYDSDSDMEAGMDEIDNEELYSTMTARREDEEALREENEHKRAKLERKRRLEMLNAQAAKKKKIY